MKILWCDTETTGLEPEDSAPFEIGFIFVHSIMYNQKLVKTESERLFFLNPITEKIKYHEDAGKIHGYSEEKIKSFEPAQSALVKIDTALNDFYKYHTKEKMYFAGYNCKFDFNHMNKLFKNYNFDFEKYFHPELIDVFEQVKKAKNRNILSGIANRKLSTVAEYLKIPLGENAHDALADIRATRQVATELQKRGVKLFEK